MPLWNLRTTRKRRQNLLLAKSSTRSQEWRAPRSIQRHQIRLYRLYDRISVVRPLHQPSSDMKRKRLWCLLFSFYRSFKTTFPPLLPRWLILSIQSSVLPSYWVQFHHHCLRIVFRKIFFSLFLPGDRDMYLSYDLPLWHHKPEAFVQIPTNSSPSSSPCHRSPNYVHHF